MSLSEGFGQSFVIPSEAAETSAPCEGALDHPAAMQQDEAFAGLGPFDDLQADTFTLRGLGGGLAREVAPVGETAEVAG